MPEEEKTYLELSEEGAGSHKFYEVTVRGKELTIRYGRIGDPGSSSTKSFPSSEKAKAEAETKIKEKTRKGYAAAVMGQRQKRQVTRRSVESRPSSAKQAPILWKFQTESPAFGIFIDGRRCWVGNQKGQIYALNHEGKVEQQYTLPEGVKCIIADDVWIYAGCDDGNVYDLTRPGAALAYQIAENVDILWLDIYDGILGVSDTQGKVTTIDPEDQSLWTAQSPGSHAWMVHLDKDGVYHGADGVTAYDLATGKKLWYQKSARNILFGWQTAKKVYAGCATDKVHCLDKKRGKELAVFECDAGVMSNASSPDDQYVFAGDGCSSIYCFNATGKRLWKLGTGCGGTLSMQFWEDKLYIVTSNGTLACLDASEAAIKAAETGTVPTTREIAMPRAKGVAPGEALETTATRGEGVELECVGEGSRLRVRVTSPGYHPDWHVQFPKDVREAGARYVVDEVRESARGGFYRVVGEIKKLSGAAPAAATRGRKKRS